MSVNTWPLQPKAFDDKHQLVMSYLVSPHILAALRILFAVYTSVTALTVLIYDEVEYHNGKAYFSYFTRLSYIGICAYFWAAGVQTSLFAKNRGSSYPLQNWPRSLQYLHILLYSTIITFPIIVTVIFWALLSSPTTFDSAYSAWANISQHIFNTVFALFEILATNVSPLRWIDLPATILLLGCYVGVAYVTHATQGFYSYSFLDPKVQGAALAGYIVGIAVGQCILFVLIRYLIVLRVRWGGFRSDIAATRLLHIHLESNPKMEAA